jgi:hypothetical protein
MEEWRLQQSLPILDFVIYRSRSSASDTKGSHFSERENDDPHPRDEYWKNNHAVNAEEEWGTIRGKFPVVPP